MCQINASELAEDDQPVTHKISQLRGEQTLGGAGTTRIAGAIYKFQEFEDEIVLDTRAIILLSSKHDWVAMLLAK